MKHFLQNHIQMFFLCCTITFLCVFIVRDIRLGKDTNLTEMVYSIQFEYYGMDASYIESLITIPLEQKLQGFSGLKEIQSVSDYGKSTTVLYFEKNLPKLFTYAALSDCVNDLYVQLPQAVQKPRIYSSDVNERAFMSIAFISHGNTNAIRSYIDRHLKRHFESIEGVASVVVSGGNITEIHANYDSEKIAHAKIGPSLFASIIQESNVISPSASLQNSRLVTNVRFDTKITSLDELKKIPVRIDNNLVDLEHVAQIEVGHRREQEIVRLNGREVVVVFIRSTYDANILQLSAECNSILKKSNIDKNAYVVVYDSSRYILALIQDVVLALAVSFVCIVFCTPLFFPNAATTALLIAFLCITCLWTVAQLHIFGYSLNQYTLVGLSLSLGIVADPLLLIADVHQKKKNRIHFYSTIKKIFPPICFSALTTIVTLVPLYFFDSIISGVRPIAFTIALMIVNTTLLSIIAFPCFIFRCDSNRLCIPDTIHKKIRRIYTRFFLRLCICSIKNKKRAIVAYVLLFFGAFAVFIFLGKDLSSKNTEHVFASIEFENERKAIAIDTDISPLITAIKHMDGVQFVQTESKRGSASLEMGFDSKVVKYAELTKNIESLSNTIPNGFLYVEKEKTVGTDIHSIHITVRGDDSAICKAIAKETVQYASQNSAVINTVLHFKRVDDVLVFIPNRESIARNNLQLRDVATNMRLSLFGPVVDKWVQETGETDIRIRATHRNLSKTSNINSLVVQGKTGSVLLSSLGEIKQVRDFSKIYRSNGSRSASFTLTIKASSTAQALRIAQDTLQGHLLVKGYVFEYARNLIQMQDTFRLLFYAFLASIIAVFLLLAILTENLYASLLICTVIPVSVFLPLLASLVCSLPLQSGSVVGMILVSGLTVNNAIYLFESKKKTAISKVREKSRNICVTSLTSILGAIPLMLLARETFSFSIAFFMLWGIAGSMIISVFLFPAIISNEVCLKRRIR